MSHLSALIASLGRDDPDFSVGRRPGGGTILGGAGPYQRGRERHCPDSTTTVLASPCWTGSPTWGRAENTDETIVDTALREAHEEVGLGRRLVTVRGVLPTATWLLAALMSRPSSPPGVGQGQLGSWIPPDLPGQPSGYRGPAFVLPDIFVWGFTAHVLDALLDRGGWSRPWDRERMVEIPEGYLGARRLPEEMTPNDIP